MKNPTDAQVYEAFCKHVKKLERRGLKGDKDAIRSLACMALLAEGWRPGIPPDDGENIPDVIDFLEYRNRLAA